jgi:iron complex outermembrane receptor protein
MRDRDSRRRPSPSSRTVPAARPASTSRCVRRSQSKCEVGAKGSLAKATRFALAAFRIETRDENRRELARRRATRFQERLAHAARRLRSVRSTARVAGFEYVLAYTWLDARFTEAFSSGTPPSVVPAGRSFRGSGSVFHGELGGATRRAASTPGASCIRGEGLRERAERDAAPAYTVVNLRAGFEQRLGRWQLSEFVRVDNVGDRRYAGSVIVSAAAAASSSPPRDAMHGRASRHSTF